MRLVEEKRLLAARQRFGECCFEGVAVERAHRQFRFDGDFTIGIRVADEGGPPIASRFHPVTELAAGDEFAILIALVADQHLAAQVDEKPLLPLARRIHRGDDQQHAFFARLAEFHPAAFVSVR